MTLGLIRPENPNLLKFLTFAPAMITLEQCIVSYPPTSRDKVCVHATRRLCPPCLYLGLVPVTSLHADGTHRLATSGRSLSAEHLPTVTFKVLFVFVILAHDRRRIVHFNITEHPTAGCVRNPNRRLDFSPGSHKMAQIAGGGGDSAVMWVEEMQAASDNRDQSGGQRETDQCSRFHPRTQDHRW